MPISEKILSELQNTNATDAEKNLMREILRHEDIGTAHYSAPYERLIKDYLTANPPKKEGKKK